MFHYYDYIRLTAQKLDAQHKLNNIYFQKLFRKHLQRMSYEIFDLLLRWRRVTKNALAYVTANLPLCTAFINKTRDLCGNFLIFMAEQ